MFCSPSIESKINRLHERVLRIIYSEFNASFENFLEIDGAVSIHVKNIQILATEIFKISKTFSAPLISKLLHQIQQKSLRSAKSISFVYSKCA